MLLYPLFCLAWTQMYNTQPINQLNYNIAEEFCTDLLPYFLEDRLTLKSLSCNDIRSFVRKSFDQWQYNTPIKFYEVTNTNSSNLTILSTMHEGSTLAKAYINSSYLSVAIDKSDCWYTDRSFCRFIRKNRIFFLAVLSATFGCAILAAIYMIGQPFDKIDTMFRIVVWSLVFCTPLIYWTCILPCIQCFDFVSTMTHEIGHILGLGHSNDINKAKYCGCGQNRYNCTSLPTHSVMFTHFDHHMSSCPAQDDINGVRTLHNGECNAQIICYESEEYIGVFRFSLTFVYSFVLSWWIVCLRNLSCRCRRKQKKPKNIINVRR